MKPGPKPEIGRPLTAAERQARFRQRHAKTPVIRYRSPGDRRARPQRWRDAVAELVTLQEEYAAWLDALPEATHNTATAQALQAIVDLDLTDILDIDPPRGFGRDNTTP
jgi:hypothetical protein